jgi:Glycosyl transferase family 2/Methyltransferase domain
MRNLFSCLVHEQQPSVVDLIRNLTYLDPDSRIVLYNGGRDASLLRRRFSVDGDEPLVHPDPKPMRWGYLHEFAIETMRFALEEAPFDTLTIVDSDQLLLKPGYSAALEAFLEDRGAVGMLGNAPTVQPPDTRAAPAVTAWRERELWMPYCRRFENGEAMFPHWTFWPSTVFTAAACRDLVRTFDDDEELARVLAASKVWATEEVILPTLVALLGYEIARSPFSYDLVRYKVLPSSREVHTAISRPDVYWVHPVPRTVDHPVRKLIRDHHNQYLRSAPHVEHDPSCVVRTLPILGQMRPIEGWLTDDEADLLIAGLSRALTELPGPQSVVEIGSFCGKASVVLGGVVRALGAQASVYAIDPHDGVVGALDQGLVSRGPTLARFERAIRDAGVADVVVTMRQHAWETAWERPISFLLVDWLHDYASVSRDFFHFERWLVDGCYIAFHDYADYFPGVKTFVQELLATGRYASVALADSMILLRKLSTAERREPAPLRVAELIEAPATPIVSCVMATYDRPHLVPQAVESFLRQTHPAIELLVVDDSPESLEPLLPDDGRVRHIRLERRRTIGAKRNLGCEAARGDLLANWDDDDWYAPWRIAYQVQELEASGADVCGLNKLLYLDPDGRRAWRYSWPTSARAWVHDAVLLFTRDFWQRNPFPDTSMGIDCRILWTTVRKRIHAAADESFYVGMIHGANTSPKNVRNGHWTTIPVEQVEELIGDDLTFYRRALGTGERTVQLRAVATAGAGA